MTDAEFNKMTIMVNVDGVDVEVNSLEDFKKLPEPVAEALAEACVGTRRVIGHDVTSHGLVVITMSTDRFGYETGLIDHRPSRFSCHPVARWKDNADAIRGHAEWAAFAETLEDGDILDELTYPVGDGRLCSMSGQVCTTDAIPFAICIKPNPG